jgi:hypothetical protein
VGELHLDLIEGSRHDFFELLGDFDLEAEGRGATALVFRGMRK